MPEDKKAGFDSSSEEYEFEDVENYRSGNNDGDLGFVLTQAAILVTRASATGDPNIFIHAVKNLKRCMAGKIKDIKELRLKVEALENKYAQKIAEKKGAQNTTSNPRERTALDMEIIEMNYNYAEELHFILMEFFSGIAYAPPG